MLTNTTEIFSLATLGDRLVMTHFSGSQRRVFHPLLVMAVFDQNGQIGDTINLGSVSLTYLHNGGLEILSNNLYGSNSSVSLSSDGIGVGGSWTGSNNNIAGGDLTYRPGGGALLAAVGGILYYVSGGTATPILLGLL